MTRACKKTKSPQCREDNSNKTEIIETFHANSTTVGIIKAAGSNFNNTYKKVHETNNLNSLKNMDKNMTRNLIK